MIYNEHPFKVILDYAHNPAGFRAMAELADRLEPAGRRTIVFSVPARPPRARISAIDRGLPAQFTDFVCKADISTAAAAATTRCRSSRALFLLEPASTTAASP